MLRRILRLPSPGGFSGLIVFALAAALFLGLGPVGLQAQQGGNVPGAAPGYNYEFWRAVRNGVQGNVSIPDKKAGVLVQSEGDNWRAVRNGPVSVIGGWALLGIIILLALFFLLRGRIRIDRGRGKRKITRFNALERGAHWLTAVSFLVLAFSGLNILYGRYVLKPLLGPELFASLSLLGKYLHIYLSFAFMTGLVLIFILWVKDNFPNRHDLEWIAEGGGLFTKGSHPPARKFNFGQKIIFWAVVLGGISISLSGLSLMFPFELPMFAKTFAVLNMLGLSLPSELSPVVEMQLAQIWHAIVALILIVIMIAHIYIGSIGMEGAFDAMGSGEVDENWAKEHHSVWVSEMKKKGAAKMKKAPAE